MLSLRRDVMTLLSVQIRTIGILNIRSGMGDIRQILIHERLIKKV